VKYLATLLGAADEVVLRWFILVAALLLDPAAVCSWQRRGHGRKRKTACRAAAARLRQAGATMRNRSRHDA
jgi:hypothetical protein